MAKDHLGSEEEIQKLKKRCKILKAKVVKLEGVIERWGPLVSRIEGMSTAVRMLRIEVNQLKKNE